MSGFRRLCIHLNLPRQGIPCVGAHSVCHARTPPAQGHYWSSVSHAVDQIESNHKVSHLRVKHVRASWVVSISVFATETRWQLQARNRQSQSRISDGGPWESIDAHAPAKDRGRTGNGGDGGGGGGGGGDLGNSLSTASMNTSFDAKRGYQLHIEGYELIFQLRRFLRCLAGYLAVTWLI